MHPHRLGSMSQGLRWKISGEYISYQWLSLAGGFGHEGERLEGGKEVGEDSG